MKFLRTLIILALTTPFFAACASSDDRFSNEQIFAFGPTYSECQSLPDGLPFNIWGDRLPHNIQQTVSPDESMLTVQGTEYEGERYLDVTVYRFFVNSHQCKVFAAAYNGERRRIMAAATAKAKEAAKVSVEKNHRWFSQNINHDHCIPSQTPAYYIREIQDDGRRADTADTSGPDGLIKVEVSYREDNGDTMVYTLYRSESACTASLPRNQAIPSRYE
ncbi:hypothetical protein [Paraburkholderia largidicola]|uniref:Lipoprotein n=1 Tax=Paraburkholderia largidicola TaxID=3014751 RepID=A0A7I8BES0_9BURK|nr:hypothetical protein [Paraburkholderia sp. PGU16]BCF87086.1 hypothetical protein PPGU16_01530 [Paraburkholderia sp. PGU16]